MLFIFLIFLTVLIIREVTSIVRLSGDVTSSEELLSSYPKGTGAAWQSGPDINRNKVSD